MLFWIVSAVLTAGVIAALARPLVGQRTGDDGHQPDLDVYRDQLAEIEKDRARGLLTEAEAQASRLEISRRMLASAELAQSSQAAPGHDRAARAALCAVAAGVPVLALSFYLAVGSPGLPGVPAAGRLAATPGSEAKVEALIARVEARLRERPGDGQGWDVIAPVYMRLGRFGDAAIAYSRAIALEGETAQRLAGFAEATVIANNEIVTEAARKAFEKVLALEPERLAPRFWLALAKEQDGDLSGAAAAYRALLEALPADAGWREVVLARLQAVTAAAGVDAGKAGAGPSAADMAAAAELPAEERAGMISRMVEGLAQKLKANGRDLAGWQKLLRSYAVLGEMDKAESALAAARNALAGDDKALSELNAFAKGLGLKS